MATVCVLIGEGKSEKAFLASFLLKKGGFRECAQKNCILYNSIKKPDLYWIFPFPSMGPAHKGGNGELVKKDTYIISSAVVENHRHIFGKNPSIHYIILTDTDGFSGLELTSRIEKIQSAFDGAGVICSSQKIFTVNVEIESWFLATIKKTFPFVDETSLRLSSILAMDNVEVIPDPKATLDDVLEKNIAGDTLRIASYFGENFDTSRAAQRSQSFDQFISAIRIKFL